MKFIRQIILTLMVMTTSLSFISCKKKKDPDLSGKALLTSKTWKYDQFFENAEDITSNPNLECKKGDLIKFYNNGTLNYTDMPPLCSSDEEEGLWTLTNNDTKLLIYSEEFNIDELTSTSLKISCSESGNVQKIYFIAQ